MRPTFSFSYEGRWTVRQARAALEVLGPEAADQGVRFRIVNVTKKGDRCGYVLLSPHCVMHREPLLGGECKQCSRVERGEVIELARSMVFPDPNYDHYYWW